MFITALTADLQELYWEYSRWPIIQQVVRCRLTVTNEDRAEDHYLKQLSLMTRKLLYFTKIVSVVWNIFSFIFCNSLRNNVTVNVIYGSDRPIIINYKCMVKPDHDNDTLSSVKKNIGYKIL